MEAPRIPCGGHDRYFPVFHVIPHHDSKSDRGDIA